MTITKQIIAALLFTISLTAGAQALDDGVPARPALWGNSIDGEIFNRQILKKMTPAKYINMDPGLAGSYPRQIHRVKLNGALIKKKHGLYAIGRENIVLINVDMRDRGYVKEAEKFISEFVGQEVDAICMSQLVDNTKSCEIWAKKGKDDINLGNELLKNGWYGWQREGGGIRSPGAGRAAEQAYWNWRGVWADKNYFPGSASRNTYVEYKVK